MDRARGLTIAEPRVCTDSVHSGTVFAFRPVVAPPLSSVPDPKKETPA
jgi:hypothetical protein